MFAISIGLLISMAAADTTDVPQADTTHRLCGSSTASVNLHHSVRTFDTLGFRQAEGVDGTAPIHLFSAEVLDADMQTEMALLAAATMGYRVWPRWKRVRPPRTGTAATAATAVLLPPNTVSMAIDAPIEPMGKRQVALWSGERSSAQSMTVLAQHLNDGATEQSPLLPTMGPLNTDDMPINDMFSLPLHNAQMWVGDTATLCDQLAAGMEPVFVMDPSLSFSTLIFATAPIPAADALDILTALAPDFGAEVVEQDTLVHIRRTPATLPSSSPAPMAMLIPKSSIDENPTFASMIASLGRFSLPGINIRVVNTRTGGVVVLMGEEGLFSHLPAPASTPSIQSADSTQPTTRETFIAAFDNTAVRLLPHRGADGDIDGLRISGIRRSAPGHLIGLRNGDVIHSINDQTIREPQDILDVLSTLSEQGEVVLSLHRRGQAISLQHSLSPSAPPPADITPAPPPEAPPVSWSVSEVQEGHYEITKESLSSLDSTTFFSQLRVVPHQNEQGDTDGFRISGLRADSFFDQLGFKNGDVVHRINDHSLHSMDNAMTVYTELSTMDQITVALTRRGQAMTLHYAVVSQPQNP